MLTYLLVIFGNYKYPKGTRLVKMFDGAFALIIYFSLDGRLETDELSK